VIGLAKKYSKSFFIDMNMQNPPKPKSKMWFVRKADESSNELHTVCGYEFTEESREDSFGKAEGFSRDFNFRMAFLPEVGHYWLSRDFAGQELKIMANLSKEPSWIKAFIDGEDIHKTTAITIWGEENYNNDMRKRAKAVNFGLLYGIGPQGLASSLSVSEEEAQEIIEQFFDKLPGIARFLKRCEIEATENKEISNPYGRKRRMHNFISRYNGSLTPAGKRRSYNFPIQSTGAEITKLALLRVYNDVLTVPKYIEKVIFTNTIHDEINFSVQKDMIEDAAWDIGQAMNQTIPGMPIPIVTGLEIGNSMGLTWKFEQDQNTKELKPVYEVL
jgi:DNA polymerase I